MDAFVLEGVLSEAECEALVRETERLEYSFWDPARKREDFRSAYTVEIHDTAIADRLWDRIQPHVVPSVTISEDEERWEREIDGEWVAKGINPDMLFARYRDGGHFSPHTDGYTIIDLNERSLFTVLVYLNECTEGGRTLMLELEDGQSFDVDDKGRFRAPPTSIKGAAVVRPGSVLVFYQTLLHEGEPVGPDHCKYIIRTDVMFSRKDPICVSPQDQAAYALLRDAEAAESAGDCQTAANLFRRAFKMSRALAEMYGQ